MDAAMALHGIEGMEMNKVQKLAAEIGVTENDLAGFIECLQVWVVNGYTFDQAIAKHMEQMNRLLNNAMALPTSIVTEAFFPA